ncbi:hypothetical protein [Alkalihalobacillus sp. LMS39]|uniref:hypothetical protein n=1 Tax=Alkalihalobacillus sp. LMS39 TaxID=2924032 RepID=UPI001FB3D3B4|nr:hypothetical protein [Alkalihalobacillus sp. LMS39]UOE95804.1 hypothetical protein MM271_09470 [Alkalihalobacillus sp. LMS39]
MKAVLLVTLFYLSLGLLFFFDGFGLRLVTEIKSIENVGDRIPFAICFSLAFLWALVGAVHFLNKGAVVEKGKANRMSEPFVAASKEK